MSALAQHVKLYGSAPSASARGRNKIISLTRASAAKFTDSRRAPQVDETTLHLVAFPPGMTTKPHDSARDAGVAPAYGLRLRQRCRPSRASVPKLVPAHQTGDVALPGARGAANPSANHGVARPRGSRNPRTRVAPRARRRPSQSTVSTAERMRESIRRHDSDPRAEHRREDVDVCPSAGSGFLGGHEDRRGRLARRARSRRGFERAVKGTRPRPPTRCAKLRAAIAVRRAPCPRRPCACAVRRPLACVQRRTSVASRVPASFSSASLSSSSAAAWGETPRVIGCGGCASPRTHRQDHLRACVKQSDAKANFRRRRRSPPSSINDVDELGAQQHAGRDHRQVRLHRDVTASAASEAPSSTHGNHAAGRIAGPGATPKRDETSPSTRSPASFVIAYLERQRRPSAGSTRR